MFFLGPSVAKSILSMTVLSALIPTKVICASQDKSNGDKDDIFLMMANKAKEAMDTFTPDPALKVDPKGLYDAAAKRAYDMVSQVFRFS